MSLIRIFKSKFSKNIFIAGVASGSADDFSFTRNGDLFTIDRINTSVIEVNKAHYSLFEGIDVNDNVITFVDSNTLDVYLATILQTETILTETSVAAARPLKSINGESLEGSGNLEINKTDIGLSNIDNTSDLNKPISTAVQTALDDKANQVDLNTTITNVGNNTSAINTIQGQQIIQDDSIALNNVKISATGSELEATDIDTLAKLNAIITDTTLISTADSRLSDARTPLSHTHTKADIADFSEGDYATAAQGTLADTALQSESDPIFQASEANNFVAGDKTNLDNQSGTNTGDETTSTIQAKRPLKTVDGETLEGSGDIVLPIAPVDSVNGQIGVVILDADDISDVATINKFATQTQLNQISTNQADISDEIANRVSADTTIQTQLDAHEADTGNPHEVTFTQSVAQDPNTDITTAEAEELTNNSVTNLHRHLSVELIQGRWSLFTNNRWVSWADLNFGTNIEAFDLNLGTGATPTIDWDGLGVFFPAGTVLRRIVIKGRANNNQPTGLEYVVRKHDVDLSAGAAIDTNAEIGAVDIASGTITLGNGGPGLPTDMHVYEIDLGDAVMTNDGDLHLIIRPIGTLTATRQFRNTIFIEYILP